MKPTVFAPLVVAAALASCPWAIADPSSPATPVVRPVSMGTELSLPVPPAPAPKDPQIQSLERKQTKFATYAGYQKLAELHVAAGDFEEGARAYQREADMFQRNGLKDAATVMGVMATRYRPEIRIFQERKLTAEEVRANYTGARLEPALGAYVGAFIDLDDQLKTSWRDMSWSSHRTPADFDKVIGQTHGSYFTYLAYGKPVPYEWLEQCKKAGAVPSIAFEPANLNDVKDDTYLQSFARQCGELKMPIFLRYASEMNGNWTAWHGNPELYREKFRIINRVFHQYAPLVATVWCVNCVPTYNIPDYYPGDDACDWVGINVYSVPFYSNDLKRPGYQDSALSYIEPIYNIYAARKPIAICEFASSHMAQIDSVDRTGFAVSRLSYMYQGLPRFFPRIKMISWFDVNAIRHEVPGIPNNYTLTENAQVQQAYKNIIDAPYYLKANDWHQNLSLETTLAPPSSIKDTSYDVPRLLNLGTKAKGVVNLSLWVKTPLDNPRVFLTANKRVVYSGTGNGVHSVPLDTDQLPAGFKRLRVSVFDDANRLVCTAATTISVGTWRSINQPLQLTGSVQRYYADRLGTVSAVDVETLGAVERIHFNPANAQDWMTNYPLFAPITAWVLPREAKASVAGIRRSWNLAGFGDEEPAVDPTNIYLPTDLTRLDAPAPAMRGTLEHVEGGVTRVITGDKGELLAVVLDNTVLVRIPPALRSAKDAEVAAAAKIGIGSHLLVAGATEAVKDGQVSVYARQFNTRGLSVNGVPAAKVAAATALKRGPVHAAAQVSLHPEEDAAKADGLAEYIVPLQTGSRVTLRGARGDDAFKILGIQPPIDTSTNKRPW